MALGQTIRDTRDELVRRFPAAFAPRGTAKRPLKVGIRADIKAAAPEIPTKILSLTLRDYTAGARYHRAMVEGAGTSMTADHARAIKAAQIQRELAKAASLTSRLEVLTGELLRSFSVRAEAMVTAAVPAQELPRAEPEPAGEEQRDAA